MSKWGKFLKGERFVAALVGLVIPAVAQAQAAGEAIGRAHTGAEKQAAVVEAVKVGLATSEEFAGHDLLNDPQTEAATKAIIDAVVNLHNIVAKAPTTPAK